MRKFRSRSELMSDEWKQRPAYRLYWRGDGVVPGLFSAVEVVFRLFQESKEGTFAQTQIGKRWSSTWPTQSSHALFAECIPFLDGRLAVIEIVLAFLLKAPRLNWWFQSSRRRTGALSLDSRSRQPQHLPLLVSIKDKFSNGWDLLAMFNETKWKILNF